MTAKLVGPNRYMVTDVIDGLPEDVAFVEIMWDEVDDEPIYRCNYHRTHLALFSNRVPPCCCIADVMDERRRAGITDNPREAE